MQKWTETWRNPEIMEQRKKQSFPAGIMSLRNKGRRERGRNPVSTISTEVSSMQNSGSVISIPNRCWRSSLHFPVPAML
jgi:hypothetical protein